MDQLYTYEILQELKAYDCYDFFKDIIWPALITMATILFAISISRYELRQTKEEDKRREKMIADQIRSFIITSFEKEVHEFNPIFDYMLTLNDYSIQDIPSLRRYTLYSSTITKMLDIDVVELSLALENMTGKTDQIRGIADFVGLLTDFNQHLLYANDAQVEFDTRVKANQRYQSKAKLLIAVRHALASGDQSMGIEWDRLNGLYNDFNDRLMDYFQKQNENITQSDDEIYLELAKAIIAAISSPNKYVSHLYSAASSVIIDVEQLKFALENYKQKIIAAIKELKSMLQDMQELTVNNK